MIALQISCYVELNLAGDCRESHTERKTRQEISTDRCHATPNPHSYALNAPVAYSDTLGDGVRYVKDSLNDLTLPISRAFDLAISPIDKNPALNALFTKLRSGRSALTRRTCSTTARSTVTYLMREGRPASFLMNSLIGLRPGVRDTSGRARLRLGTTTRATTRSPSSLGRVSRA